jgi:processing peptidase subunit alpha
MEKSADLIMRAPANFLGGDIRATNPNPHQASITVAYESCKWQSPDMSAFFVLNQIMGQATPFSSGGPGKGMYCRAITHLM